METLNVGGLRAQWKLNIALDLSRGQWDGTDDFVACLQQVLVALGDIGHSHFELVEHAIVPEMG